MTPNDFHARIKRERGKMRVKDFFSEFEGFTENDVTTLASSRIKKRLPSVRIMLKLDVLFTTEEMTSLLLAKLCEERLSISSMKLANDYLRALGYVRPKRSEEQKWRQSAYHKAWTERAALMEMRGDFNAASD